jgi:hypothetical protein
MVLKNHPKIFLESSGSMETKNMLKNHLNNQIMPGGKKFTSFQAAEGPVSIHFSPVPKLRMVLKNQPKTFLEPYGSPLISQNIPKYRNADKNISPASLVYR